MDIDDKLDDLCMDVFPLDDNEPKDTNQVVQSSSDQPSTSYAIMDEAGPSKPKEDNKRKSSSETKVTSKKTKREPLRQNSKSFTKPNKKDKRKKNEKGNSDKEKPNQNDADNEESGADSRKPSRESSQTSTKQNKKDKMKKQDKSNVQKHNPKKTETDNEGSARIKRRLGFQAAGQLLWRKYTGASCFYPNCLKTSTALLACEDDESPKKSKSSENSKADKSRNNNSNESDDDDDASSSDEEVNKLNSASRKLGDFRSIRDLPVHKFYKINLFEIVQTVNGPAIRIKLYDKSNDDVFYTHLPRRLYDNIAEDIENLNEICSSNKPFYFAFLGFKGRGFKIKFTRNPNKKKKS